MTSSVHRKTGRTKISTGFLDLSQARLVATGGFRHVYEHDDFPGMLVKVLRPEFVDDNGQPVTKPGHKEKWFKLSRRLGAFLPIHREIAEFLAYQSKRVNRTGPWPMARLYGFVETSMGLGLVTEKLTGPDGDLAPTLSALVQAGRFSPRHEEALRAFFRLLDERHICMSDLNPRNLAFVGNVDSDGRFVAIDGLGSTTLFPVQDWFASINARRNRRRSRKIWRFIENGGKKRASPAEATVGKAV